MTKKHLLVALAVVVMLGTVAAILPAAEKAAPSGSNMYSGKSGPSGGATGASATIPGYSVNVPWLFTQGPSWTLGQTVTADLFSGMPSAKDNEPVALFVTDASVLTSAMGGSGGTGGASSDVKTPGAGSTANDMDNMNGSTGSSGVGASGASMGSMGRLCLVIAQENRSDSKDALRTFAKHHGKMVNVTGRIVEKEGLRVIIIDSCKEASASGGTGGAITPGNWGSSPKSGGSPNSY